LYRNNWKCVIVTYNTFLFHRKPNPTLAKVGQFDVITLYLFHSGGF